MRLPRNHTVLRWLVVSSGALIMAVGAQLTCAVTSMTVEQLPQGSAPPPVRFAHFPSRLHAVVWRNWEFVPTERIAATVDATPVQILELGRAMGLDGPPSITKDQQRRSAVSTIRRNWHLLPYEQLLKLLQWTPEELAFALREDDFLFIKLGSLKPRCERVLYQPSDETTKKREVEIASFVHTHFPEGLGVSPQPLFSFVRDLSNSPLDAPKRFPSARGAVDRPRICYSFFALYGDPLLDAETDPYPDGLLARLSSVGVNGVWLQGVLNRLAPFPWDETPDELWKQRMGNLRRLVARAKRHGIGVYLYMNEPRAMPESFYASHPEMRGVQEGDYAALCTSAPEVDAWLSSATESICREVPDLAGFFTITASENLTNCWSHGGGSKCPRCGKRTAPEVISALLTTMHRGIRRADSSARLIAWDWGWGAEWADSLLPQLPRDVALMSVSEWNVPITRGGVASEVGEYSMSSIGPGPRALRHWKTAEKVGLPVMAKIQAGNTWELSAVPYIPVCDLVARHCARLRDEQVTGLLLGWTLGGYPSPNLEVANLVMTTQLSPDDVLSTVSNRRYGPVLGPAVMRAWREFGSAFEQFPFHIGVVYNGPLQVGPANLLWEAKTGYAATMVGFPYDDVKAWRSVYPPNVYIGQLRKVAGGFQRAVKELEETMRQESPATPAQREAVESELRIARASALHFESVAAQAEFILARDEETSYTTVQRQTILKQVLREEMMRAMQLKRIQESDSRIGFEASNQYYYTPLDLAEKALNCEDLLGRVPD